MHRLVDGVLMISQCRVELGTHRLIVDLDEWLPDGDVVAN